MTAPRIAATGPGPWRAGWALGTGGKNIAGRDWLTFYVRGTPSQELYVELMDHHKVGNDGYFDVPHFGARVPLIAGGYLKSITPAYQKVRIPMIKLLPKGTFFLRWHTAGLMLSAAQGSKPGTYYVSLVQIEP